MGVERKSAVNLADLVSRLEDYYGDMKVQMLLADRFYEQEPGTVKMRLPEGVPFHIPSTPTNIIDNMSDQIRTDEPSVELKPRTESDRENIARLQRWGYDRFDYIRNWSETNIVEQAKADLLLRGAACWRIWIDESELPDPPVRADFATEEAFTTAIKDYRVEKAAREPFRTRAIDPLDIYVSPGNQRPLRYVVERQRRTVIDMEQYGEWADPQKVKLLGSRSQRERELALSPAREVEWIEYWDDERYVVEVDGDRIIDQENPYGFVPYIWDYSGLGRMHSDGNPRHLAIGLLTRIVGELMAEIRIKTAWDAQWQYHIFPTLMVKRNAKAAAKQLMVGPGRVIEWGPLGDDKPEWLNREPPDATMVTFLDRIDAAMRRYKGEALQGSGGTASEYGILEAMRIGQALKVIGPVMRTLNRMGSQLLTMMARMAYKRNLAFKVRSSENREVVIEGQDFLRRDFMVDFESIDAAENDRRLLIGESLHDKRLISRRTFHVKYGKELVEDPDDEASLILAEAIEQQMLESGVLLQASLANLKLGAQPTTAAAQVAGQAVGQTVPPEMQQQMQLEGMMSQPMGTQARNVGQMQESELGVG